MKQSIKNASGKVIEGIKATKPHVKTAMDATTEAVSEGVKAQKPRINSAIGGALVLGGIGLTAGALLPVLPAIGLATIGLAAGGIHGYLMPPTAINVYANQEGES